MSKKHDDDYIKGANVSLGIAGSASIAGLVLSTYAGIRSSGYRREAKKIRKSAAEEREKTRMDYSKALQEMQMTIKSVDELNKFILSKYIKPFLNVCKRVHPNLELKGSPGFGDLQRFAIEPKDYVMLKEWANECKRVRRMYTVEYLGKIGEAMSAMCQDGTAENFLMSLQKVSSARKTNNAARQRRSMDDLKVQSIIPSAIIAALSLEHGLAALGDMISAKNDLSEAEMIVKESELEIETWKLEIDKIKAIDKCAKLHLEALQRLFPLIKEYVIWSVKIIKSKVNGSGSGRLGEENFTEKELNVLEFTFSLVNAVKKVIDSPIISRN